MQKNVPPSLSELRRYQLFECWASIPNVNFIIICKFLTFLFISFLFFVAFKFFRNYSTSAYIHHKDGEDEDSLKTVGDVGNDENFPINKSWSQLEAPQSCHQTEKLKKHDKPGRKRALIVIWIFKKVDKPVFVTCVTLCCLKLWSI